jgi:hypothetical protein
MQRIAPFLRPIDGILLALAIVNVVGFTLLAISINDVGFPLDDSWIHQTYARNLADTGEWAFVPGEESAGSTAPLYTLLLMAGHVLNLSPYVWAHFLGILALFVTGFLSVRLAERLFPNMPYAGPVTGLVMVMTWHLIWAAASGMETMLFMALSLGVIWLTWQELDTEQERRPAILRRGALLGVTGGLLYLTRPEGVGLLGLAGLSVLVSGIYRRWQDYIQWALAVSVGFILVTSPYLVLNYDLTGELLPTTADAKVQDYAALRENAILARYVSMLVPVAAGGQILLLPGIVYGIYRVAKRMSRREWVFMLPVVWAFAHLTLFVLRLPANYQHGRYVMPILPPLLLFSVGGMLLLLAVSKKNMLGRVLTRTLALSAIGGMLGFWVIGGRGYGNDVKIINTEMVKSAKWIDENVPRDELLAVHDIGAVGYFAPRDILDLAGLVSPEIVPLLGDDEALVQKMCEENAQWLMVFPDQLPFPDEDDPRLEEVFSTDEPFTLEAGGSGNMTVFRVQFGDDCGPPLPEG